MLFAPVNQSPKAKHGVYKSTHAYPFVKRCVPLRSIRIQVQIDHLRFETPSMVHKETYTHFLAYNFLRETMVESALLCDKRTEHQVGDRPNRIETRKVKRFPKKYKRLREPRYDARKRMTC